MSEDWEIDETEEREEQEQDVLAYQISSYPADITLKGYLDKWDSGQLEIPPLQRNYVWDELLSNLVFCSQIKRRPGRLLLPRHHL